MGLPKLYHRHTQTVQHMLIQRGNQGQTVLRVKNSSSIHKLSSKGEITTTCLTSFELEKLADVSSLHFTWHNWLLYM